MLSLPSLVGHVKKADFSQKGESAFFDSLLCLRLVQMEHRQNDQVQEEVTSVAKSSSKMAANALIASHSNTKASSANAANIKM